MDKNAIKTFAIESRRKMIESVKYQASLLGITADGIKEPISKAEGMETYDYGAGQHTIYDEDIKKRESLVREINNKGFENVVEEVAYTWFNRIIAIRYMEVNDYLPTYTRVLSSEIEGKIEPDIITEALDLDLDYSDDDREKILKFKMDNDNDKLFQFLFIKQCNKLNEILPGLFEKTDDYMELLLDINFTDDGIIKQLIYYISEDNFEEVEIIGWLYQYYIYDRKNDIINVFKAESRYINKEDIPAVTQLFTPNWIVKYMVDNSLGKYWIERNPQSNLVNYLTFYFDEPKQKQNVLKYIEGFRKKNIAPSDIKFFDPCMGSGHILIYAFDVFFEIYKELGYYEEDIPKLILSNNLYGLDIDKRAYQLAYFALMMKARANDRNIFKKDIVINISSFYESNLSDDILDHIYAFDSDLGIDITYLNNIFINSQEFGSLIKIKDLDFDSIIKKIDNLINEKDNNLGNLYFKKILQNSIIPLINQGKILSLSYDVVVTNPPYMNRFDKSLKDFSKKNFKDYSKDLFSMFIYRNFDFCKKEGYLAFMTPMVWLFIKSYENLRNYILNNKTFVSLIEFEYHALWEIDAHVPACTFVLGNFNYDGEYNAKFLKLSEFTGGLDVQRQKVLDSINNTVNFSFISNSKKYKEIPGSPIAYWISEDLVNIFRFNKSLKNYAFLKQGLATGNNKKYLKYWFEVPFDKINFNSKSKIDFSNSYKKFCPYNKGGSYKRWYGNQEYVINFDDNAYNELLNSGNHLPSRDFYFKECISWSALSSSNSSFRYYPQGFVFDVKGSSLFFKEEYGDYKYYILGFLNSKISQVMLDILTPTLDYNVGYISLLPFILDENRVNDVNSIVLENISISQRDWDSNETSWNFLKHNFLFLKDKDLGEILKKLEIFKKEQINILKDNEVKLNNIFQNVYNLEMSINIEEKNISLTQYSYELNIKSFISYAVGCMFGRYSLDEEGLQFAGGEFNINNYSKFIPDDDNIIPVLDTEYFNDDIVGRFVEFVKVCFGEETLEENLDFIAGALKKKGKTSREIIRNYFLTDFFKDHAQTYKKCPIYWQFDSGKQNAFKCLIYMHRYEPGLVARVRTDYLHKTQKAIEQNLAQCENIIANSSNKSEISKAKKDKTKYIKQLDEIKVYDEALAHIANQRIEIDLDDGVKVNHAKFQNVEISKEGQKAKKINLLKKI